MNVSVITPAWNAAATISETLDSLVVQTHKAWQAIVVDDGSTDETPEIVRRFAARDRRFRLVQQRQTGTAAARNTGLLVAETDWVLFLDADDWIAPTHLERLTAELAAHPELGAVHCGSARVALDRTMTIEQYQPPTGDLFPVLARRPVFPVHACIVRRSLIEEVGGFNPVLTISPDWDLWQRIARTGAQFGAVRTVEAFYRMRPHSASLEAMQLFRDDLEVLRQGHAPDPRVPNPHPTHAEGEPSDGVRTQEFYLLSWCAGLMLGQGQDPRPLLDLVGDDHYPEIDGEAVARCIFDSAPLPTGQPPSAWGQTLWPGLAASIGEFLAALEGQTRAPSLSGRARVTLERLVLHASEIQAGSQDGEENPRSAPDERVDEETLEGSPLTRNGQVSVRG
jgi:hypothetical protein